MWNRIEKCVSMVGIVPNPFRSNEPISESLVLSGAHLMLRRFSFWNPTDGRGQGLDGWMAFLRLAGHLCPGSRDAASAAQLKRSSEILRTVGYSGRDPVIFRGGAHSGAQTLKRKSPVCF